MKIKDCRNAKGYTQEYMARTLNISLRNYQLIEHYEVIPNVHTALQIAYILEVDVHELWKRYKKPPRN